MITVPALKHDAEMLARFGHKVSANGRLERRIVAALCAHLAAKGFPVASVWDGEEETKVTTTQDAMELVFNLDEALLRFAAPVAGRPGRTHGVLLVLGNGEDIISDWNYTAGDPDGFNAAMEGFDVEVAF